MTQEDKELLLKDLYTRLPYGTIIRHEGWNYEWDDTLTTRERVTGIDGNFIYTEVLNSKTMEAYRVDKWPISTFDDKPYLRPMSSMTEEEHDDAYSNEVVMSLNPDTGIYAICALSPKGYDWLNAHHFDYRGLIEKGLALEAPEGMYND